MPNQERKQRYNYSILCGLVQRHLETALENAKTLPDMERSKKEARLTMSFINSAIASARHYLNDLETLVWKNEQTN
jgi:hypothetical protein